MDVLARVLNPPVLWEPPALVLNTYHPTTQSWHVLWVFLTSPIRGDVSLKAFAMLSIHNVTSPSSRTNLPISLAVDYLRHGLMLPMQYLIILRVLMPIISMVNVSTQI
jgi:hypothetical protein